MVLVLLVLYTSVGNRIVKAVYLQRDLFLIQWTYQVRVNVGPFLLHKTLFPVLPKINHINTVNVHRGQLTPVSCLSLLLL